MEIPQLEELELSHKFPRQKKSNAPIKKQIPSISLNDTFICLPSFYK